LHQEMRVCLTWSKTNKMAQETKLINLENINTKIVTGEQELSQ